LNATPEPELNPSIGNNIIDGGNGTLLRWATYASVSVAVVLIIAKFFAWLMTDSVSLLSTLIDSILDAAASLINLIAVHHALQPADREHRFGHGKAEPLAGLAQAAFISGSAAFLLLQAGERLFNPRDIMRIDIGVAIMGLSIILTVILVIFQLFVVRRTGSIAIKADSLHYQTDVLVNASVIVSLMIVRYLGWHWTDPVFAIAIAAYIVWGAWRIGVIALDHLMDRELADDTRAKIREIALSHPDVKNIHDLKTRSSGNRTFIQVHLEMDGTITLVRAHEIAEEVMDMLTQAYPGAEVLVHQDPEGIEEVREFD
jgi:ferrous-iron efflux pump FieF